MSTPQRMTRPHRMNAPPRRMNAPGAVGSMFPHTVTVYNTTIVYDDDYNGTLTNHITVLRGVFLEASKGDNIRATGLTGADAVNLYIPNDVDAEDGINGAKRKYIPPIDFFKAEDQSEYWTMSAGSGKETGKDTATFFIKGEVVEPDRDRSFLESAYDDVYSVTKVDNKDFGSLAHLEVGGV